MSRLKRENNLYNNQTIVYNYDNGGNITSKVIYPYTTASSLSGVEPVETINYEYGDSSWTDLLTSYNGEAITYDTIGNPLSYRGSTLSWTGGRELKSLKNANNSISYTYDANGLRATKTVNGVKSTYEYVGDQLVYEKRGNMDIYYLYDSLGNLSAIRYADGTVDNIYYAVCNSRGDVEAFYNGSGTLRARYVYDSWGNVIKVVDANGNEITDRNNVAFINPIRYRGYYYDTETGLYYLQSRYYDPEVGRFINADGYVSTGQGVNATNMFAYCGNNPVIYSDPTGEFAIALGLGSLAVSKLLECVVAATAAIAFSSAIAQNPPTDFTISHPKEKTKSDSKTIEKETTLSAPPRGGTTYYHVTTPSNAANIMMTGTMVGSTWEGGYVYAWRQKPSKYAIKNSGANFGVTISFKTTTSFIDDTGIKSRKISRMYGPVVSARPGPIKVWDVQIVG